ncbi:uncharacterized protein LOC132885878 isoform X2 [Neoarius graeffei]|uniref:uncharacterized protein LOC132885878 isoform X2 n=1 Tax=Neoarius graeffei TaxID=443677 RepID=UPI00298BFC78|nr:uncharacterized protein LOC132885878 isoform X2 [Neoarius graeffei]
MLTGSCGNLRAGGACGKWNIRPSVQDVWQRGRGQASVCDRRAESGKMTYWYAVVEFLAEGSISVVPREWIESDKDGFYSYWPRDRPTRRAEKRELPDKQNRSRYQINIMSFTEDYSQVLRRAKKAENTSNLSTDDEPQQQRTKRRAKPNKKFMQDDASEQSGEEGTDDNDVAPPSPPT